MSGADEKETADNLAIGSGKPGPGRPKGVPNKVSGTVKDVIAQAADALGGKDRLVEWAQSDPKNEAAFWTSIYPKLLPKELTGQDGAALFPTRVEVVAVKPE